MEKKRGGILLVGILLALSFSPAIGGYPLLQDTEPPVIHEVAIIPNPQITGGNINVTALVLDNIQVNIARVVITYPDSSSYNITMNYIHYQSQTHPHHSHYYNVSYNQVGMYHFYIWANDTSNNQNLSDTYTFEVIEEDLTPPVISGVHDHPDPQISGGIVNITCTVTDNIHVDDVHVIMRYPNYHIYNYTLTQISATDTYYFSAGYSRVGIYHYYIWAKDTSDNTAHTSLYTFMITEEPGPSIRIEKKVKDDCHWIDSTTVYVGDNVPFRITVFNTGMVTLTNVHLTDTLPSFLEYNYDGVPSPSFVSGHQIGWSLGSLHVGESRMITYSARVIAPGRGHNVAFVTSCAGVEASSSVFVAAYGPSEDIISVEKKVRDGYEWVENITSQVDETLDFQILVANSGSSGLTSVHLTDTLPSFLEYNYDGVPSPSFVSGHQIGWSLGSLHVGESKMITYSARVIAPGRGYNEAFACSGEGVNDTDTVLLTCFMEGEDTTPPLVSIDKPSRYLYVADRAIMPTLRMPIILGGITLEAIAMDDESGIDRVEFMVGNDIKHVSHGWPFDWFWNESSFGFYSLKTRAYDNAGNSDIDSIDVYIINF